MTLRLRLALGVLGIAAVFLIPLGLAIHSVQQLHRTTRELRDGEFAASLLLGRFRGAADDLRRAEDALLFVHDGDSQRRMSDELTTISGMADSLEGYRLQGAAAAVRGSVAALRSSTAAEFANAATGNAAAAEAISSRQSRPQITAIERAVSDAEELLRTRTRGRVDAANNATGDAERAAAASLVIALLLASLIAIWLTRSISRPVFDLEAGMHAIAEGDFAYPLGIRSDRHDEFGRLATGYRSMAEQLAQLDKLKAEFISVASHELKTPINVIVGYIQLLEEGLYGELTQKQLEICAVIGEQGKVLTRLVRRLLDVSRFEAGSGKLEVRQIDLTAFLETLESSFHVLAMQRGILFHVERAPGLPATVFWDEDRVNEVLGNLTSNALKFTNRDGRVDVIATPAGDAVQIVVRDTGAGIPPDELPHVFEKFFQADNQAAAAVKGTGLGLAIAKQIVEAHNGSINVDSHLGEGTTFTITLPVRAVARRARHTPPAPVPAQP